MKHLLIALTIVLPGLTLAAFSDVPEEHTNRAAINYVESYGIVSGYSDGTFRPANQINRAEFTKIVIGSQIADYDIRTCDTSTLPFPDVPANSWFAPYVCVARNIGVIQGYDDGTFRPEQNISFVEAAKIIANTFEMPTEAGGTWYEPFAKALSSRRAIPTSIQQLDSAITRGEMAEMIYRLQANVLNKTAKIYRGGALTDEEPVVEEPKVISRPAVYENYTAEKLQAALGKKPVALFFYAMWCPSCRILDTTIQERLDELPNNSLVLKVDYDFEKDLVREYVVPSQHTAIFFDDKGTFLEKKVGFSFADLEKFLKY